MRPKDLGDADKEIRSRAAPTATREVARRYYESHREGIDEAIREGGGASQPPRPEKLSDVRPVVAGPVGEGEAEEPLGRELAAMGLGVATGDLNLLSRVPKDAIVALALNCVSDAPALQAAYRSVTGRPDEPTRAALGRLARPELLRLIQGLPNISRQAIRTLYEEHRYRGMKSLYLYECQVPGGVVIDVVGCNESIARLLSGRRSSDECITSVSVAEVEEVRLPASRLYEVHYSYVAPVHVVHPATECPGIVEDLRAGFAWINPEAGWIAICARDEVLNDVLVQSLYEQLRSAIRRVSIPKSVVQRLEPMQRIRRASHYEVSTGTTRRLTNANMAADPVAMAELSKRDETDDRPASGFTEKLPDNTAFAVGYANAKGKIYFSRDLTVSQMRGWAPAKITDIIDAIRALRETDASEFAHALGGDVLNGLPTRSRPAVLEIALAVAGCNKSGASETRLDRDALELGSQLARFAEKEARVECDECEEPAPIRCAFCQGETIVVGEAALVCSSCKQAVDRERVECCRGHQCSVAMLSDLVRLVPLSNLQQSVGELVAMCTGVPYNAAESYFHVSGQRLVFGESRSKTVRLLDEIPELAALLPVEVPERDREEILTALGQFKEKYGCMNTENCAGCVAQRRHEKCLLRLLGLFDPDYTPRPHQGDEYGDYSRMVTLDGAQRQLCVAMKTGKPSGKEIRSRQPMGRDIATQVTGYRQDGSMDIIGICVPQKLEDGFKSSLRLDAQRAGKSLVFIDLDGLVRIVYGAMQRHGIGLEDI